MIDPHPIGPHLIYEGDVLDVAEWLASGEGIGLPAPAELPLFEKGKTTC